MVYTLASICSKAEPNHLKCVKVSIRNTHTLFKWIYKLLWRPLCFQSVRDILFLFRCSWFHTSVFSISTWFLMVNIGSDGVPSAVLFKDLVTVIGKSNPYFYSYFHVAYTSVPSYSTKCPYNISVYYLFWLVVKYRSKITLTVNIDEGCSKACH